MKQLFKLKVIFKNKKILPIILLIVLLSVVGLFTYAAFTKTFSSDQNMITSGVVSMSFTESSNTITINNALPMSDSEGQALTSYFDFSVTSNLTLNNGDPNSSVNYNIEIELLSVDNGYTALTNDQIKVYLENITNGTSVLVNPTLISNLSTSTTGKILYNTSHVHSYGVNIINTKYRLRAWIDMNVSANDFATTNYEFKFRVNINGDSNALSRPVVENLLVTNTIVTADVKSERDITYYGFSENASTQPTEWTAVGTGLIEVSASNIEYNVSKLDSNNKEVTFLANIKNYSLNYTFGEGGDYYLWLKDDSNIVTLNNQTIEVVTSSLTTLNNLGYQKSSVKDYADSFWTKMVDDTDDDITNDSGIYRYTDESGTTYIYRGHINNNWVKFGKDSDNNDIYWRIVRVTGTGEIRMIYAGIVAPTESTQYVDTTNTVNIGTSAFNTNYDQAEYVGYQYTIGEQYGRSTDSTIKTTIDTWYTNNMSGEDIYISTSNYCYDRNITTGTYGGYGPYSGTGYGRTNTWFAGVGRLLASGLTWAPGGTGPSLVCGNTNDNYTLKIALLSVDEASLAGLKHREDGKDDTNNYLITNKYYWTGSPFAFYDSLLDVFTVRDTGRLGSSDVNNAKLGVRPVISLKSNIDVVNGTNGTWEHPYEFVISE